MSELDDFGALLKQKRDELKLQMHLASKEAEDEWEDLLKEWDKFMHRAQLEKSADEIGEAARELGVRVKAAFDRMRKSGD